MKSHFQSYTRFCIKLRREKLLRSLPKEHDYIYDFSHNDYLGLSQHPALIQAAIDHAQEHGVGSKASRILAGRQVALRALERDIALAKHTEDALVFATGYQANLSVLSAILDKKVLGQTPLVFSDKYNHASMNTACQLARAKFYRYQHLDYDHLRYFLKQNALSPQPKFILTESVFGMDGDVADLETLIPLAKDHNAMLYIDEAHATGLYGSQGYGFTTEYTNDIDIVMGTFSKALGSSGAYIACSRSLKRYLLNRSGGLIYSTAPSPVQVAIMHKAWELISTYQSAVKLLIQNADQLRSTLNQYGYHTLQSTTHIIPVIFKDPETTLKAQRFLATFGIKVCAIRPPTVPQRQSRLRIALSTNHSSEAIKALSIALALFIQHR